MNNIKKGLLAKAVIAACLFTACSSTFAAPSKVSTSTKRIIVKFKESGVDMRTQQVKLQERTAAMSNQLGSKLTYIKQTSLNSSVFALDDYSGQMEDVLKTLAGRGDIEYVEEDLIMRHYFEPNDPQYSAQWHYNDLGVSINAEDAWDKATGDGVVVAVLDTGYRPHADLNANILPGYDMISDTTIANDGNGRDSNALDPGDAIRAGECGNNYPPRDQSSSWHGTHVAGTIAAITNNNLGVAGVAFDAKILPVRVLGRCGGYTSDIADGIVWASGGSVAGVPSNANPAQVINMSLGGGGSCSQTYRNAINAARANGTTVVVAAGNSNQNVSGSVPANCDGVVAVASTGPTGSKAYYSNYGSRVDVAAPGGDLQLGSTSGVLSTANSGSNAPANDTYEYYQGTSMAAPHVAGVAALMYEANPSATPSEIETALVNSGQTFPGTCNQCGSGIVDASLAIDLILGSDDGGDGDDPVVPPETLNVSLPSTSQSDWLYYTIEVPAGAALLSVSISGGSGDADLYVRRGVAPTTSSYDYRPYLYGNNETVNVPSPQADTWHIGVRAYTAFSGVTLTATAQ